MEESEMSYEVEHEVSPLEVVEEVSCKRNKLQEAKKAKLLTCHRQ